MTEAKAHAIGFIVEQLDQVRFLKRNHPEAIWAWREWLNGLESLAEILAPSPAAREGAELLNAWNGHRMDDRQEALVQAAIDLGRPRR